MVNRLLPILISLFILLIFYSCSDNSTDSDSGNEKSVVSGKITATDGQSGIQDALLELSEKDTVMQETYSDVKGKFSFTDVESGEYEITMTLPQGFRESGATSKMLQVDNDVSIEFVGEPVQSETVTIEAGKRDTLATGSGAFVSVNALNSSSDVEISVTEIQDESQGEKYNSNPIKIRIHTFRSSKANEDLLQASEATNVDIEIGNKISNLSQASWVFSIETETNPFNVYADAKPTTIVDPFTKKESEVFTHSISTSSNIDLEFNAVLKRKDDICSNDLRKIESVPDDKNGDIPLILIHGLQIGKSSCEEFENFEPVNLSDGEDNTFDTLVEKLFQEGKIDNYYQIYTYRYPTNASVKAASAALMNEIQEKNLNKPVIIAHSMGGLVGRSFIQEHGEEEIRGLVTLGTPHEGTPMTELAININDCTSNSIKEYLCTIGILDGQLIPNTRGFRDLRETNDLIKELMLSKGNPSKIFTLGGQLNSLSDISGFADQPSKNQLAYMIGYEFMKDLFHEKNEGENDGIVPVYSALPDWSGLQVKLDGHDHTEMVKGEDFNVAEPGSIMEHLAPLLEQLANFDADSSPSVTSIISSSNPSNIGETITFSAEITGDEPIDCEWDFGSGDTSTECNTSYSYSTVGTYTVSLTATNNEGTDTATLTQEVTQSSEGNIIYVDADANGSNNGTSWANAYNYLQDALVNAENGNEMWVAEGTYFPDQGKNQTNDDREASFQLVNGVEMYGGFDGTESVRNQRNWEEIKTILSGEIGSTEEISDNSTHVVIGSGTGSSTLIDGFIVTKGYANEGVEDDFGGGMYNDQGSPQVSNVIFENNYADDRGGGVYNNNSNPKFKNVTFRNNEVFSGVGLDAGGGAMYNRDSNPYIENCQYTNNNADNYGGAIVNDNNSNPSIKSTSIFNNNAYGGGAIANISNSNPMIINVSIRENVSEDNGGGIFNHESNPTLLNVKFIGNSADDHGGAIYNDHSNTQVINSIFTGNTAGDGGGIYDDDNSHLSIINSTFSKNSASDEGGGIYFNGFRESIFTMINVILWGNTASDRGDQFRNSTSGEVRISYSIIENGFEIDEEIIDEGNNLISNPLFINAVGPDNIPGTLDDNLRLQSNSPAINAGLNNALDLDGDGSTTDDVPFDLDGNTRIQSNTVELGAYEFIKN